MSDDDLMLVLVLAVGAFVLFSRKPAASGSSGTGSTGVSTIGPGGAPLLNCCDANGNIVDAGNSMYCPTGSTVCS